MIKSIVLKLPKRAFGVDGLSIKELKKLQLARVQQSAEEFDFWLSNTMEALYPELSEYEREFVFMHAFNYGMGRDTYSGLCECPSCKEDAKMAVVTKQPTTLSDFEVVIPDPETKKPYIKLVFELPDSPGGIVKDPKVVYQLNTEYLPEEFEEYEITPRENDIVEINGQMKPWSPFIPNSYITKLVRPISDAIDIKKIDPESIEFISEYLSNFNIIDTIREKSSGPVNGRLYIRCDSCGYDYKEEKTRISDIIRMVVSKELDGLYKQLVHDALAYSHRGFVSYDEVDKMTILEFTSVSGAIKNIKKEQ